MQDRTGVGRQKTSQELIPTSGTGPPPAISTILDTKRARSDEITEQNEALQTDKQVNMNPWSTTNGPGSQFYSQN